MHSRTSKIGLTDKKAMPTRKSSLSEIEAAFRQSEASVSLEGIAPLDHPCYRELKARVVAGEITPDQAVDLLLAARTQLKATSVA
jgi:hypothetical protein